MKIIIILSICAVAVFSAAVENGFLPSVELNRDSKTDFPRCYESSSRNDNRICGPEEPCDLIAGHTYCCETDYMPSTSSRSLTLKVEICLEVGFCMQIINTELPNSSVQPGVVYTLKYCLVPNDILAGQTVGIRICIIHTDSQLVDYCTSFDANILPKIA